MGAPSEGSGTAYHAGAVYIYSLAAENLTFENPQSKLYSYDRAARFGKSLVWAGSQSNEDEHLIVSAPSYTSYNTLSVPNEQGKVYWYRGAAELNGQYSTLWAAKTFETEEYGCRHGDTLKWVESTS